MEILDFDSNLSLPEQIALTVERVSVYDYSDTAKVASLWRQIAKEKASLEISDVEQEQFEACSSILGMMENSLLNHSWWRNRTIYVCKDSSGNYQGMMALEDNVHDIYIALLVTNPINIRSSVNEMEPNKVRGAGTSLLNKAEELAQEKGKNSLTLYPLDSAIPFYEKYGFEHVSCGMRKGVDIIHEFATSTLFEKLA